MYCYENTGSVYRRSTIPRQGSSPDFGHRSFPFPVSQWALKQLPYTVTASFRIHTGFSFTHHEMMLPVRYNFIHIQFGYLIVII